MTISNPPGLVLRPLARSRMSAAARESRPYAVPFDQVLTVLEEISAGEQPVPDRATLDALVDGLENAAGAAAPVSVRRAVVVTPTALHDALLDWQDALEVRDGREPERRRCAPKVHERWMFSRRLDGSLPIESRLFRQRRRAVAV